MDKSKPLHGKVMGYDGDHKEKEGVSYTHHKNGQGQEVFGPSRSGGAKMNYGTKTMHGATKGHIGAGPSSGGKGVVRPMGGLV